ncbi:hypothetical protein JCM18909_3741 [Cutibacterium acnes JCM 18909]|nr:hypothetical protein JCM18909_3741 [Cutibacterium acnes JCM 18909]
MRGGIAFRVCFFVGGHRGAFVGGHRGAFVVVWGSQASPMPSWSVSVWSWLAMVGQLS